jgi:iron complex outermembrane receptor protein
MVARATMHARSEGTASPRRGARSRVGLAVAAALAGVSATHGHAALAADGGDALAAAGASAAAAPTGGGGALQEVVVTARKVQENLQDVPISINVFTQKDLQNLAITGMDDYLQKVPSVSYISTGPGTQLFVMRGVSDGSNPNYANTSSTGFFVDDMSMSFDGAQPDLHLYDVERIEVLNGPQGTTFGAGSMSGAIRYITNKPDVHAFSAGVDFDGGKVQSAQENWTEEGFINIPIVDGILGFRASAFSDSHGGFINNQLVTRTWVNGSVSDNAQWARNDYNREHVEGGRAALKANLGERWSLLLTYLYQRQHTLGAWDEDPTLAPRTVERFGPESNEFQTKAFDFHVDGDVGIGDLVFASTYWSQPRRQWNEYSQYEQNFNAGAKANPPGGFPGTQEGFTCQNDPYFGTGYAGCKPPVQFYYYFDNSKRWSDEVRLASKPGGRFHWLVGAYWEKTGDNYGSTYYMPNLVYGGKAFQSYLSSYGLTQPTLPPGQWFAYTETSQYWQTTEFTDISFDITDKLNVEAGAVHFHSRFNYFVPYSQFAYGGANCAIENAPACNAAASYYNGGSSKWNGKLGANYKITDKVMVYADWAQGFRDGGTNGADPPNCYKSGVPTTYTPDTLNNYELGWKSTSLQGRLLWNGAAYFMDWKQLQALIYDALVCPSSSYNINVGDARIYGAESNINYAINDNLTLQASANYTDAHVTSAASAAYQSYVGERLPFAPYFSWSWNARYEQPLGKDLHGYAQFDMAHKGDMWNGLNPEDKTTGLPRVLQPDYTLMNLRFGLTPPGGNWLVELYVDNLTDKNAIVYSNTGNFDLRLTTNEPRVYGLRVNYRWGKVSQSAE